MRITIYPEVKDIAVFQDMIRRTGVQDMNALATRALLLFEWAVDMVEEGQRFGAIHKAKNEWTELTMPGAYLAARSGNAKATNRIVLQDSKKTVIFSYDAPKQLPKGGARQGIALELKDECGEILQDMAEKTGSKDYTQVLGVALGVYLWSLNKLDEGFTIGSMLESRKIWTDLAPVLKVTKPH